MLMLIKMYFETINQLTLQSTLHKNPRNVKCKVKTLQQHLSESTWQRWEGRRTQKETGKTQTVIESQNLIITGD